MRQVALISGSTRGIGRAIAGALAQEGFAVAINARKDGPEMADTLAWIRSFGAPAIAIPMDLSDPAVHKSALDTVERGLGPMTTLICNAGTGPLRRVDLLDAAPDSLDHCLGVNARGPFFLAQSFARRLLARHRGAGHHSLVFVSSANAEAASLGKADYCVSKAALAMVAKLYALKLCPQGIQVVDIRPGVIETDLSASVIEAYRDQISQGQLTLVPRVGSPADVAEAVAAIATGRLPYIAGSVLHVDGGLSVSRF